MEIFVNGQAGIAGTDDDVRLGDLFEYLQREFVKQRLLVRAWMLDGEEVFPDGGDEATTAILNSTPEGRSKLEIQVAPFEVIAHDVLVELETGVPELAGKATQITEMLQKSDFAHAREELVRFSNSAMYVSQAMTSISTLLGIDLPKLMGGTTIQADIEKLGSFLKDVETALNENDFVTVGDILEFDVGPATKALVSLLTLMRQDVEEKLAAAAAAAGANGDGLSGPKHEDKR
jgi:hypothetical protein